MNTRTALLIVCCMVANVAQAQVETTSYLMSSLPQYVSANPAFVPRYKFSLGLPVLSSFSYTYTNNGFTYNDLVRRENGTLIADLSEWAKNLPDRTYVTTAIQTDLFRLGVRINSKLYLTLHSSVKGYGRVLIPKQLAALLVNGTSPYIGQTLNISPELHMTSYLENGAGLSVKLTDELTIGARLKILHGLVAADTETSRFGLTLDENYQITATGDFRLRSSGLYNFTQSNYSFSEERKNYFSNRGWGLDVGATYQLMDKLTVAASLVDLGGIRWRHNTFEYLLQGAAYTFTGIDVDQLLDGDATYMEAQIDSLESEFELQEAEGAAFRSPLPGKFYLSGQYEVMRNLTVGALWFNEKYRGRVATGFSIMMNKNFGRALSTSLSYTMSHRSFNNLGAGISFNFAPFQIYLVGDNLLRMPLSLATNRNLNAFINNTQVFTLRAGINFVWGWTQADGSTRANKRNANRRAKNSLKKADYIKVRQKK